VLAACGGQLDLTKPMAWSPQVDVEETDDAYVI
jgi:hypothetical protein